LRATFNSVSVRSSSVKNPRHCDGGGFAAGFFWHSRAKKSVVAGNRSAALAAKLRQHGLQIATTGFLCPAMPLKIHRPKADSVVRSANKTHIGTRRRRIRCKLAGRWERMVRPSARVGCRQRKVRPPIPSKPRRPAAGRTVQHAADGYVPAT
jgi:hypothetical protein